MSPATLKSPALPAQRQHPQQLQVTKSSTCSAVKLSTFTHPLCLRPFSQQWRTPIPLLHNARLLLLHSRYSSFQHSEPSPCHKYSFIYPAIASRYWLTSYLRAVNPQTSRSTATGLRLHIRCPLKSGTMRYRLPAQSMLWEKDG